MLLDDNACTVVEVSTFLNIQEGEVNVGESSRKGLNGGLHWYALYPPLSFPGHLNFVAVDGGVNSSERSRRSTDV